MDRIDADRPRDWRWLRFLGWAGAIAIVVAPLLAMRFAPGSGVHWTGGDFVVATVLIGAVGLALEAAARMSANRSYRLGSAVALGTGLLLVWANLAVGYIGSENNPYNQLFFAVGLIAMIGAALARFRAKGMAVALFVTAVAHAIVGGAGFPQDTRTAPITIVFTALWLAAAALFRDAAKQAGR